MPALPDNTTRFSSRVKDYVAYRPSYPPAVIDHLDEVFKLPDGALIVDVGSGTGISSALLLDHLQHKRVRIIGVEPNKEMREAGDEFMRDHTKAGRFTSRDGTAEQTGLEDGSVNLIIAAQAFHWFDIPRARAECQRILKKSCSAGVALIWNDRRGVDTGPTVKDKEQAFPRLDNPVMNAYDLLLVEKGQNYKEVGHHHTVNEESLNSFFGPKGFRHESYPNPNRLTYEQLRGRLLSSSYTPQEGQEGHEELIRVLGELFDRYQTGGMIDFIYDTRVFSGFMS